VPNPKQVGGADKRSKYAGAKARTGIPALRLGQIGGRPCQFASMPLLEQGTQYYSGERLTEELYLCEYFQTALPSAGTQQT
jgi:hypothetical protein